MKVCAIIPAAGRGIRFGAAKQFQPLGGKPVLLYSLEAFESSALVDGIFPVISPSEESFVRKLIEEYSLKKIVKIIAGGEERQDSVRKGFEAIAGCEIVLVHDGARPFVTASMIEKTVLAAREFGAAVVGLPVRETVKTATSDLFIQGTVDRSSLWNIQTPQAFRYDLLREALERAKKDHFLGTDEAMLVERTGKRIRLIEGSPYNIKITTPEDLKLAEAILDSERRKVSFRSER